MKRLWRNSGWLLLLTLLAATACSSDDDDYRYPAILTEMVELYCDDRGMVYEMHTDNDSVYTIDKQTISGYPNAYVRCLAQYTTDGTSATLYNSLTRVSVLRDSTEMSTALGGDPVSPRSMWMSGNGRYLNMSFTVLGREDVHNFGYRVDSTRVTKARKGITYLSLYHNACNDPESYSFTQYASVQLSQVQGLHRGDSIYMDMNTTDGVVRRGFVY
jgi:hypothetical protein